MYHTELKPSRETACARFVYYPVPITAPGIDPGMSETSALAQAAYREDRATHNARIRWLYAMPLFGITVALLGAHLFAAAPTRIVLHGPAQGYAAAFAYLAIIALAGIAAGRKPRGGSTRLVRLLDDAWMGLLMPGAGALATLDATGGDISAFTMICLPVAIFHSTSTRDAILLQACGFACASAGILYYAPLDPASCAVFLSFIGASAAVFAYIGIHVEQARKRAFTAVWELNARSSMLEELNERLEHKSQTLAERSEELARLNADLEARSSELEAANRRLDELAGTDPLTGIANRRQLFEATDREFGRARRFGSALALAILDLDDFGPVNKMHGVIAGDEVLRDFAALLRRQVRSIDVIARYGGEEFVIVMPDCTLAAAAQLLERVRASIETTPLSSRHIMITVSAGVAALSPEDHDPANMLHRADTALRKAKAEGKNRVECS